VEAGTVFTLLTFLDGHMLLILKDLLASKACQRWKISVKIGGAEFVTYPDSSSFGLVV